MPSSVSKIDQDQRPVGDRHDARHDRAAKLQHHAARADRTEGELVRLHRLPPGAHSDCGEACQRGAGCKLTARYTYPGTAAMRRKSEATRQRIIDAAYECRSGARASTAPRSTPSPSAPASPSARSIPIFAARTTCSKPCSRITTTSPRMRLKRIGDRMPADRDGMIDSFFGQLAGWASATPRWSGSGFTRLVVELADLPGPSGAGARPQGQECDRNLARRAGFRKRASESRASARPK